MRLEAFYSFNERFAKIRSKRITKAVKGIIGKQPSDLIGDSAEELSKSRKTGKESEDNTLEPSRGTEESLEGRRKPKIKRSRKRKDDGDTVAKVQSKKMKVYDDPSSACGTSEMENLQPSMQTEDEQFDGKDLIQNRSGRGRGRGRDRGMGIKRGRQKEKLSFQSHETETSSGSSDIDDYWLRMDVDEVPKDVQRVNLHSDLSDL